MNHRWWINRRNLVKFLSDRKQIKLHLQAEINTIELRFLQKSEAKIQRLLEKLHDRRLPALRCSKPPISPKNIKHLNFIKTNARRFAPEVDRVAEISTLATDTTASIWDRLHDSYPNRPSSEVPTPESRIARNLWRPGLIESERRRWARSRADLLSSKRSKSLEISSMAMDQSVHASSKP